MDAGLMVCPALVDHRARRKLFWPAKSATQMIVQLRADSILSSICCPHHFILISFSNACLCGCQETRTHGDACGPQAKGSCRSATINDAPRSNQGDLCVTQSIRYLR